MHIGSSFHSCCCIRSVVGWWLGGGVRYETRYQIWPIDVKHEDDKITRCFSPFLFFLLPPRFPPALLLLMAHNVVKFDCHYLQIQLASPQGGGLMKSAALSCADSVLCRHELFHSRLMHLPVTFLLLLSLVFHKCTSL